jgi:hypothetical protein
MRRLASVHPRLIAFLILIASIAAVLGIAMWIPAYLSFVLVMAVAIRWCLWLEREQIG